MKMNIVSQLDGRWGRRRRKEKEGWMMGTEARGSSMCLGGCRSVGSVVVS